MHRFYLAPDQCRDRVLTLNEEETHHAANVLRVRAGERLVVLDGAGQELLCEAQKLEGKQLKLTVVQRHIIPPLPYQLTLVQAIPKGKLIEGIIQKAVELGAHRVVPLISDRVTTQLDDESAASKLEKWQLIAIEASKQCGSAYLPQIELPVTPKAYLAQSEKFELPLVASLQSDCQHPREYVQAFYAEKKRLPKTVSVWVGPEGDFTPAEMNAIKGSGVSPITLGRLVLRCETAAIYSLAVLNYELQSKYA